VIREYSVGHTGVKMAILVETLGMLMASIIKPVAAVVVGILLVLTGQYEKDATAKGFLLIARKAKAAVSGTVSG
jgi:hypothetical protein